MKGRFRLHPAIVLLPVALAFTVFGLVLSRRSEHLDFVATQEAPIPRAPLAANAKGRVLRDYVPPVSHAPTLAWLEETPSIRPCSSRLLGALYAEALKATDGILSQAGFKSGEGHNELLPVFGPPLFFTIGTLLITGIVAWLWSLETAGWLVLALVTVYPLGSQAWPGLLDAEQGAPWWVLGALLPLAPVVRSRKSLSFLAAGSGLLFGAGLLALPAVFGPLLIAVLAAGVCSPFSTTTRTLRPFPWRTWSLTGAGALLVCGLYEAHGIFTVESFAPLLALAAAWTGFGFASGGPTDSTASQKTKAGRLLALGLALAAAVLVWFRLRAEALVPDELALRLAPSSETLAGFNVFTLLQGHLLSAGFWAALSLPLLGLPALRLWRQKTSQSEGLLHLALPAFTLVLLGLFTPPLFTTAAAALLALWLAAMPEQRKSPTLLGIVVVVFVSGLGAAATFKDPATSSPHSLSEGERQRLAERTVAHQLAVRLPGDATILAPSNMSSSLAYYGSLHVLRHKADDTPAKVATVVHILRSASLEEAQVRLAKESITAVVLPSWDPEFATLTRLDDAKHENRFYDYLQQWSVPGWLRPLAVALPGNVNAEENRVTLEAQVYLVQEETDRSLSLGRFADYFLETGNTPLAALMLEKLKPFSNNANGLIALAEIHKATGDTASLDKDLRTLQSLLKSGYGPRLVWDRQLSLAVVLAQAGQLDLAKKQFAPCISALDTEKLHALSPAAVYRLLFLARAFELPLTTPALEQEAKNLLTKELLARLDAKP